MGSGRGGGLGVHLVFYEVLPPLPLDFGPARGAGVPLGFCLSRAGSLLLLLLLREVGAQELALLLQTPFSRFSLSVDSPQFSPHVPRRENSGESSVSCSRVLSSCESRSSERGSRVDKRARSREVSSRGRRSRSSYRSRLSSRERGRRSSSASRSSRGRSRCERLRSSDRCRSQRGSSRSRRAWSRSSDRYRSRRDRSWRERSRSFDRYHFRRERARSHACRGVRRGRSRSHALPNRSRDRSRSSVRLPASPARLRAVEAGRLARRGPQEGVEAFVSQPPVAWSSGGRPSCSGGASIAALLSVFLQELAKFFMSLSGSSSLGAPGVLAGVTASAAASEGIACPSSTAAGAATFCAATVTPAGAGVLPAAPAAGPGVSGDQQRQGMSRSGGRRSRSSGDGTDRRA